MKIKIRKKNKSALGKRSHSLYTDEIKMKESKFITHNDLHMSLESLSRIPSTIENFKEIFLKFIYFLRD